MRMKASTGSVNILKAKKDGLNISQYLKMEGGTLNVSNIGDDAVQVSLTDDSTDEDNGQVMISGGTVTLDVTATAAKGIKSDGPITISGGTITITTSGGGEYDSEEMDTDASSAIKSDSLITINGGMITLKSTGAGGKGISSDTDIVINGGTINVTTTGQKYVYGAYDSSPKGMKADNNLTIMGGDICVTATGGEGSEGIESKNVMTLGGGDIVINTYDDAINATNKIIISDGRIFANSTRNDAIDSNGTIDVTGGLVIACGTTAPEGGFDCDQNTFTITGGTLIGLGGSTSTPSSQTCTQPVIVLGGKQLQQDAVIGLAESNGSCLFTFTVPQQLGQATMLLSCPGMSVGNTYTISSGATLATDSEPWQGYTSGGTSTGATTMASLTLTQTVTTSGNTGGGPGGGGPGGGGGRP